MTVPTPTPPAPRVDPDRPCPHLRFVADVAVGRMTRSDDDPTVVGYSAEITVRCDDCKEPFRWNGVQAGMSPARPMCSIDETTLIAPLRPASADPDFGMGLPGYAVNFHTTQPPAVDPYTTEARHTVEWRPLPWPDWDLIALGLPATLTAAVEEHRGHTVTVADSTGVLPAMRCDDCWQQLSPAQSTGGS